MLRRPPPKRLVIGIANRLRGDDGVGAVLAEQAALLGARLPAGTPAVRSTQQLTPELAEDLAPLDAVLFIDAWLAPAGAVPELQQLSPTAAATSQSHRLEPAELLAICEVLYGRHPRGHLLRVPGFAFEHGTALSRPLRDRLPAARVLLQSWLHGHA